MNAIVCLLSLTLLVSVITFKSELKAAKEPEWDSRSAWVGFANGVKAGCQALVYSIDGEVIPEEISSKLFDFADTKQNSKSPLCEQLYNEALKNGMKHYEK